MFEGYPLMAYESWAILGLTYLGVAVLGGLIAYGIFQWRQARREQTPTQKRQREQATREAFRDHG